MEGKPYRGSRGGAKAHKKKFYETQDFLRKLLKKLAARWGEDYHLPRIEYDAADPAIASIEDIDWSLVTSLDTLVVHVLACTVPSLRLLLDKLKRRSQATACAGGRPTIPAALASRRGIRWPA